jgi:predicted dithiol-disulfide oxidoreductase (DUF899 family)
VQDYTFEEGPANLDAGDSLNVSGLPPGSSSVSKAISCHRRELIGDERVTETFKYDLGSEDREGNQDSTISVFSRASDGTVRHFYSAHPRMASDIQERGIDLLSPIWNVLDLTPQGRGNWYTKLEYPKHAHTSHG